METYILTGEKSIGKTSLLLSFINTRKDVAGVITLTKNGRRYLLDISSKNTYDFETDKVGENTFSVGRFIFLTNSFSIIEKEIVKNLTSDPKFVIIDEVGPLEIKKDGFYFLIKKILQLKKNIKFLLVVRITLIDAIVKEFGISNPKILIMPLDTASLIKELG